MPSEYDLPRGPLRDFVEELFGLYREARRPTLREISRAISEGDFTATASTETVRRMLRGDTVPAHWATVAVVVRVLCEMAETDPEAERGSNGYTEDHRSPLRLVEDAWHRALDDPDGRYPLRAENPWAAETASDSTFSDEPPF